MEGEDVYGNKIKVGFPQTSRTTPHSLGNGKYFRFLYINVYREKTFQSVVFWKGGREVLVYMSGVDRILEPDKLRFTDCLLGFLAIMNVVQNVAERGFP
jgi:hypothetical protein